MSVLQQMIKFVCGITFQNASTIPRLLLVWCKFFCGTKKKKIRTFTQRQRNARDKNGLKLFIAAFNWYIRLLTGDCRQRNPKPSNAFPASWENSCNLLQRLSTALKSKLFLIVGAIVALVCVFVMCSATVICCFC